MAIRIEFPKFLIRQTTPSLRCCWSYCYSIALLTDEEFVKLNSSCDRQRVMVKPEECLSVVAI